MSLQNLSAKLLLWNMKAANKEMKATTKEMKAAIKEMKATSRGMKADNKEVPSVASINAL